MSYTTHADLGGQAGHGPIHPEPDDPLFHAGWEARALALTLAMGATGAWTIDMSRAARETLPDYARLSYYQIWLAALEKLLVERALVSPAELLAGRMLDAPRALPRILAADAVPGVLARGASTAREPLHPASFAIGQTVRTVSEPVAHHTRLPAYARGKRGVIERVLGTHVFADRSAMGDGDSAEWLYTVVFEEGELWGSEKADQGLTVSIDAWEPYLCAV